MVLKKILSILLLAVGLVSCDEFDMKDNPADYPDVSASITVTIVDAEVDVEDIAKLPGFEEAVAADLERIEEVGMYKAMEECLK